jgi:nucleotide-binding universal stress UspA family protein
MQTIIGVDGSELGWEGVRQAATLLSAAKDRIALYYAPPKLSVKGAAASVEVIAQARASLANAVFDEALLYLPTPFHAGVTRIVGEQSARHGLKLAADQCHAGMVVVGARGLGQVVGLLLGSVTRSVLRGTTRPILVTKPKPLDHKPTGFRVIWAVEEVPQTPGPVEFLKQLSWPEGATAQVLHVVDPLTGMEVPEWFEKRIGHDDTISRAWVAEYDADKRRKFDEMAAFTAELPRPFGGLPLLVEGNPANMVLKKAKEEHADLIIIGTRDMGTVQRLILGSTAETVLQYAHCSVLVLHLPNKP